jgi:hypothetical protein
MAFVERVVKIRRRCYKTVAASSLLGFILFLPKLKFSPGEVRLSLLWTLQILARMVDIENLFWTRVIKSWRLLCGAQPAGDAGPLQT